MDLFLVFLCLEINKVGHEWETNFSLQGFNCR